MKNIILIISCFFIQYESKCQTSTTYYRYGYGGRKEKIGYSETKPIQSPFSEYTPSIDANLYREVLIKKQNVYEKNVADIQSLISTVQEMINILHDFDTNKANEMSNKLQLYINALNNNKLDYSDYNTVFQIKQKLISFSNEIYNYASSKYN